MQALEKTPADRFQKMSEFAERARRPGDRRRRPPGGRTSRRRAGRPAVARRAGCRRSSDHPGGHPGREVGHAACGCGRSRRLLLAVLVAAGSRCGGSAFGPGASAAEDPSVDKNRIAVLYFENRGGADSLGYLADGLTEALIHELSEVKPLQVISRNGVAPSARPACHARQHRPGAQGRARWWRARSRSPATGCG